MKLPKSINVFGSKIKIKQKALKESGLLGYFDFKKNEIVLDSNDPATFLHEALHSILHRQGWNQVIPNDLEELLCEHISIALTDNFKFTSKKK